MQKKQKIDPSVDYWKYPQKGFPQKVKWKIIAGPPGFELSELQKYDLIFDKHDLKIRQLI